MEKEEFAQPQLKNCPLNPVERNGPQEDHTSNAQSMYCKELVYEGDTEFCFEELRAQRYFKKLNEKVLHLGKVKEELKFQIEQKQKFIQERSSTIQNQQSEVPQRSPHMTEVSCAPLIPTETAPLKIYSEPEVSNSSIVKNSTVSQDEHVGQRRSSRKQRSSHASKILTIPDEKPNTRANHKTLKLPTSIFKIRQPAPECTTDKDASISRSEEAIINGHWNKTLCRSPNDTCDFVRAAQLASTPFAGPVRQTPSESGLKEDSEVINKTSSVIFKEPNADVVAETKKLSPIQEISHEWGYTSTYSVEPESGGRATTNSGNTEVCQISSRRTGLTQIPEAEAVDPCSLHVRKALLDNVDLSAFSNYNQKAGPLPEANNDLDLDGETFFFKKMYDVDRYLYYSNGGNVLVKVDKCTVPWDFYINSQLRARLPTNQQHCHAQSTCYLYDNGSLTLWRVPQGETLQDLLDEHIYRRDIPLLAIQLLEMVKQMHSCQIVHGALRPDTLMLCQSGEDSVIMGTEFSSSLDLDLQPEVKTVQALPSAQDYIKQGLLLPTASPYQVDLYSIAEIVHLMLFRKSMKLVKEDSYLKLDGSGSDHSEPLDLMWKDFFHNILNPEEKSTESVLSELINTLKKYY